MVQPFAEHERISYAFNTYLTLELLLSCTKNNKVHAPYARSHFMLKHGARSFFMPGARAFFAALLSSIVPGTGHLLSKRWRRAAVLLGISGLVLIAAFGAWQQGTDTLLAWLVQPRVLLALLVVNLVLLCFRLFALIDSYRVARTPAPAGRTLWAVARRTGLGVLVLATLAPHIAAGYYNWQAYHLLTTVFTAEERIAPKATPAAVALSGTTTPTTTPTTEPTVAATPTIVSAPQRTGAMQGTPVALPPDVADPTTTPMPTPGLLVADDRLNILLLGGDAGPERRGLRTDTMIVASIDPATKQAALFGVPRNLHNVPLPEPAARQFPCRCWPDLLNGLYGYAHQHPDLFPPGADPGAAAMQATIGQLLGIKIDYYALVDLGGFVDVIDAAGGVTLDVPEALTIRLSPPNEHEDWQTYDIPAGRQHLDGRTALAYVRSREGTSDYDRMQRQRCVLSAVAREADAAALLGSFPRLASVVKERVATNVPVALLPDLIKLAAMIDAGAISSIGFAPPRYNAGWTQDEYPIPDVDLIQHTVATVFDAPAPVPSDQLASSGTLDTATADVETAAASCGWTE
jgi:LCP family protein required for cell wall assembly